MGERTLAAARQRFEFTPVVDRAAAGGPSLRCAALVARRPEPRPRAVAGLRRTFVGRGDELDALEVVYRRVVEQGRPQVATVIGEAGVGKSTLVERLVARLDAGTPAPVVRSGRSLAYGQGITYAALAEILRAHLGLEADAAADRVLESLSGREILGLTCGLDTAADLDPRDARQRLHTAWVALVEEMVGDAPAVFVLEDLHSAQQPLLDLVADLVNDVAGALLVVATARPEYAETHPAALGPRRQQQTLWLERLTDEQAETMLKALLGEPPTAGLRRSVSTVRALLLCAVARVHLGEDAAAASLVRLADELAGGYDDRVAAPHIRLALARRDLDRVAALMAVAPRDLRIWATWWLLDLEVTRLDALTALRDVAGVEAEAPPHLGTGDFIDAVARRALGAVRRDPDLLREAAQAFARMDLPSHVELTRALTPS